VTDDIEEYAVLEKDLVEVSALIASCRSTTNCRSTPSAAWDFGTSRVSTACSRSPSRSRTWSFGCIWLWTRVGRADRDSDYPTI